jgi:hypothetical protein
MYTTRAQKLFCAAGATAITGAIFSVVVSIAGLPPEALARSTMAASKRAVPQAIKTGPGDRLLIAQHASTSQKESVNTD